MTTEGGPPHPDERPGPTAAPAAPRRRPARRSAAPAAKVLTAGVSISAAIALIGVIARSAEPAPSTASEPVIVADASGGSTGAVTAAAAAAPAAPAASGTASTATAVTTSRAS